MIKLGYVSRALPRDNRNHVILGTQAVKPRDFAAQVRHWCIGWRVRAAWLHVLGGALAGCQPTSPPCSDQVAIGRDLPSSPALPLRRQPCLQRCMLRFLCS